jgi:hypothetical protein
MRWITRGRPKIDRIACVLVLGTLFSGDVTAQNQPNPERLPSAASPEAMLGRGTAVLEKVDDRWIIMHLHISK